MIATNYYSEAAGGGLRPATPVRIVCYDEGDGEWTIDTEDANGSCIRDENGHYPASVWHDEEAIRGFIPWTRADAISAAVGLAAEIGLPALPIYVSEGEGPVLAMGGFA